MPKKTGAKRSCARLSLSARIAALLAVIICCCSLFFAGLVLVLTRAGLASRRSHEVLSTLNLLESAAHAIAGGERAGEIDGIPYYMMYRIYAPEAAVLLTNDPMIPDLPDTAPGRTERFFQEDFFADGNLHVIYAAKDVEAAGQAFHIQAALDLDMDASDRYTQHTPAIFLLCAIPIICLSWIIAWRAAARMLSPIKRIIAQAEEIGSSSLMKRLDESGADDELRLLARTFNDLFARLEKDFEREKRFTADVSHELKTPIAVISGHADLLLRWGKDDPQVLESSLEVIRREAASMAAIAEQLLALNRAQSPHSSSPPKEKISAYSFLHSIKEDFAMIEPRAEISVTCAPGAEIETSPESLKEILRVVIKNGIQYNESAHPKIEIAVEGSEITVRDNGIGIAAEDLPHIFESFYRADKARTRSRGGAGIGLAIAKAVAENIGARISAESSCGEGTTIRIRL